MTLPLDHDASADAMNDWLLRNKDAIRAGLDESFAQAERGEGYSLEQANAILADVLAQHRAARAA